MSISPERLEARRRLLLDAACALIREKGDAGFSMVELARRAGVSPATPYNLVGTRSELLRLVVGDEFERFRLRLAALPPAAPLDRLLEAVDLLVRQYAEDPDFYRGLYRAAQSGESAEVARQMMAQGRSLWSGMVAATVAAGDLDAEVEAEPLTDVLLRTMGATIESWLASTWPRARFGAEMAHAVRLIVAAQAAPARREGLRAEVRALQAELAAAARASAARKAAAAGQGSGRGSGKSDRRSATRSAGQAQG